MNDSCIRVLPTSFQLGSRTWKVEKVERPKKSWLGSCSASRCRIRLNMALIKDNDELHHTFIHELLHAVASTMGWSEFNDDEEKIDAMANLLTQVERTIYWEQE